MHERILLDLAPSPWFIVLRSIGSLALLGALAAGLWWTAARLGSPRVAAWSAWTGFGIGMILLVWQAIVRACIVYVLTDRRIVAAFGVFRRTGADVPLTNVQHLVMDRTFLERVFGVGTIGVATAGTGRVEVVWMSVPNPEATLSHIRRAADDARSSRGHPESESRTAATVAPEPSSRPLVIGLAGGIGSGKSEVGRMFGELGAVVIDSDKEAKAALDREEVRQQLVSWWGSGVLDDAGRVDRRRVAGIVFSDPEQRLKLERLIHPLVRATREGALAKAREQSARAVVVDAPLLFEAGLDKECDKIVFVESPRQLRLERLRSTRGWDEGELSKRENTQISLEEKQKRADHTITNDGGIGILRQRVLECWRRLLGSGPRDRA